MSTDAYLGIGTNMGDREANIETCLSHISHIRDTQIKALSKVYETEAVGPVRQDRFLNMVAAVSTLLPPEVLFDGITAIEAAMKRNRTVRWGPRTIDIDLLLYDSMTMSSPVLTIPHPRMYERAFVLIPLKDVLNNPGDDIIPDSPDILIDRCADKDGVVLYGEIAVRRDSCGSTSFLLQKVGVRDD